MGVLVVFECVGLFVVLYFGCDDLCVVILYVNCVNVLFSLGCYGEVEFVFEEVFVFDCKLFGD